jgi:putative transposase
MKVAQIFDNQLDSLEGQLIGINAKKAPSSAVPAWSGGRKRILGKGPFESYCYHVMSRTCGGEVFFDDVENEACPVAHGGLLWREARDLLCDGQSLPRADRSAGAGDLAGDVRRTWGEEKLEAIKKRFCDLSLYVKQVKERFCRWFNKRR